VILLLKDLNINADEQKRLFYVAITRAKSTLTIHYNGTYLKKFAGEDCFYNYDKTIYPDIDQISMLLNHKDVISATYMYNIAPGRLQVVQICP
jgi:ATP-dependent DNA helicase RecQ